MLDDVQLIMDEYMPLRDVVFETLRKAILQGKLKPGERLMEIGLANALGVSRTPVREAIRKLELEGLVTMIPRKGAEVADITEKGMQDVLEVRRALEALAVELACQKMTEAEMDELEKASEAFRRVARQGELMKVTEADVAFHELIYKATDNPKLIQMLSNLREQMYRYRVEYLKDGNTHTNLAKEHEAIVEAIRGKDVEKAKVLMISHIDNQQSFITDMIKKKK